MHREDSASYIAPTIEAGIDRLEDGEPFVAVPLPQAVVDEATEYVSKLPTNIWEGELSAGSHAFQHWIAVKGVDGDTRGLWDWREDGPTKLRQIRQLLERNPVAGLNSGMVNCYTTRIHAIIGPVVAAAFDAAHPRDAPHGIGHNRMCARLKSEDLDVAGAKYHYEGQQTGRGLGELTWVPIALPVCFPGVPSVPLSFNLLCAPVPPTPRYPPEASPLSG